MDVYQRRRLVALSALAAIFVILVLLIRSCGGDDEEGTPLTSSVPTTGVTEPTPLTQDEFASQGDAICLETNTSLDSLDSADATQDATDRAELLGGELNSLQSLTLAPGEQGETKLENFLASLQTQVQAYDDLITATDRGDEAAVADIQATIDEAAADTESAAQRFGFDVCGDTSQVSESSGATETGEDTATAPATPTTTVPAAPTTTTPAAPPADGGGATPEPPPTDDGDGGGSSSGSGGITP